jgi:hypothetical protein
MFLALALYNMAQASCMETGGSRNDCNLLLVNWASIPYLFGVLGWGIDVSSVILSFPSQPFTVLETAAHTTTQWFFGCPGLGGEIW